MLVPECLHVIPVFSEKRLQLSCKVPENHQQCQSRLGICITSLVAYSFCKQIHNNLPYSSLKDGCHAVPQMSVKISALIVTHEPAIVQQRDRIEGCPTPIGKISLIISSMIGRSSTSKEGSSTAFLVVNKRIMSASSPDCLHTWTATRCSFSFDLYLMEHQVDCA